MCKHILLFAVSIHFPLYCVIVSLRYKVIQCNNRVFCCNRRDTRQIVTVLIKFVFFCNEMPLLDGNFISSDHVLEGNCTV